MKAAWALLIAGVITACNSPSRGLGGADKPYDGFGCVLHNGGGVTRVLYFDWVTGENITARIERERSEHFQKRRVEIEARFGVSLVSRD